MFKLINGWTKERMLAQIKAKNNGTPSTNYYDGRPYACLYLQENGNRCFVGCFIPDDHRGLRATMNAGDLLNKYPDLQKSMPLNVDGLMALQGVHDHAQKSADTYQLAEQWINENVE